MNTATKNLTEQRSKVLLLIDWDNIVINLCHHFQPEDVQLNRRIKELLKWIRGEIGEIFGEHGFAFTHEHFSLFHQKTLIENHLKIMLCPKEPGGKDTVDAHIIWFAKLLAKHPDVGYLCLASGDSDFVEMLKEIKEEWKIKIALAVPTLHSFSISKDLVKLADKKPKSQRKMVLNLADI